MSLDGAEGDHLENLQTSSAPELYVRLSQNLVEALGRHGHSELFNLENFEECLKIFTC